MMDANTLPLAGARGLMELLESPRSFGTIAEWAAGLRLLGSKRRTPPSEPTIRRVLQRLDVEEVDPKIGHWLLRTLGSKTSAIALDGKSLRRAHAAGERAPHLLSAIVHAEAVVIAQVAVEAKTNEIPKLPALLDALPLEGTVVTADALHTQVQSARYLVEKKKADYLFTVKDNQPRLREDIEKLNLIAFPPQHVTTDKAHGRLEIRRIWASMALNGYLDFPHVAQVFTIERIREDRVSGDLSHEVVQDVTSLSPEAASPARLLELNRNHWAIENRLHWVRDVTFDEDRCRIRHELAINPLASFVARRHRLTMIHSRALPDAEPHPLLIARSSGMVVVRTRPLCALASARSRSGYRICMEAKRADIAPRQVRAQPPSPQNYRFTFQVTRSMKLLRIVSALAFTLFTGTAAFAAAAPLPAGITAVPLAVVTNDRDSSISHLELLLDGQAIVRGIYMVTSAGPDSSDAAKTAAQVYPLAKIESSEGVVLGQGQGVKAIFLRGTIATHAGEGSLVIRYLTNGVFRHYAECRIDLQRLGPDHWQLINAYDGRPVGRIQVRTWALGTATVANVCPGTTLG